MAFIPYNANPLYKDTDDCTVRAISLFTGKTYDETFVGIAVTGFELKQVMVLITLKTINGYLGLGHPSPFYSVPYQERKGIWKN